MLASLFYVKSVNAFIIGITDYTLIVFFITTFIFHNAARISIYLRHNFSNYVTKCNIYFIFRPKSRT